MKCVQNISNISVQLKLHTTIPYRNIGNTTFQKYHVVYLLDSFLALISNAKWTFPLNHSDVSMTLTYILLYIIITPRSTFSDTTLIVLAQYLNAGKFLTFPLENTLNIVLFMLTLKLYNIHVQCQKQFEVDVRFHEEQLCR